MTEPGPEPVQVSDHDRAAAREPALPGSFASLDMMAAHLTRHSPEWVAATMQPGPNGVRFDTADLLAVPAAPPTGILSMFDATDVHALPSGALVYAGYYNGTYANLPAMRARFPHATIVSVTPDGAHGAEYIDIEPGNVTAAAAPGFIKAGGLGFYASPGAPRGYSVQEIIDACTAAGLTRSEYRVWSAHWIGKHICGPATCGYPQADGTQYLSTFGWDESDVESPGFFSLGVTWPLRPGEAGPRVAVLQKMINTWASHLGLAHPLTVDGDFGPATEAAVVLALIYWHYNATAVALGEVDQSLWAHLAQNPASQYAVNPVTALHVIRATETSLGVAWHPSAHATGYHVSCIALHGSRVVFGENWGQPGGDIPGLVPNTAYRVLVTALPEAPHAVAAVVDGTTARAHVPPPPPHPGRLPGWQVAIYHRLPEVRKGMTDGAGKVPWVRQVQLLAAIAGPAGTTPDGVFGPATENSVRAVQRVHGIQPTGVVDADTWQLLAARVIGAALPVVALNSANVWMVKRVQALCCASGFPIAIDGVFGTTTQTAVEDVQRLYLRFNQVDGVVGPVTWSCLLAHVHP